METMSNRSVLKTNLHVFKEHWIYHSNGEVIIDNIVWGWISLVTLLLLFYLDLPSIHINLKRFAYLKRSTLSQYFLTGIDFSILCKILTRFSFSYPPPHLRQRARSLPVPRGRMATGGLLLGKYSILSEYFSYFRVLDPIANPLHPTPIR